MICPPAPRRPGPAALACWLAAVLLFVAPAQAGPAHEHGVVRLDLALDGPVLTLEMSLPLDSLLGFERAPRSAAERQAAAAVLARLRDDTALLRPNAEAQCQPQRVSVHAPVLAPAAAAVAAGANAEAHADVDAGYVFQCAQPERLASLTLGLFDAFPRVQRVELQAALPQGQRKLVLRRGGERVARLLK